MLLSLFFFLVFFPLVIDGDFLLKKYPHLQLYKGHSPDNTITMLFVINILQEQAPKSQKKIKHFDKCNKYIFVISTFYS